MHKCYIQFKNKEGLLHFGKIEASKRLHKAQSDAGYRVFASRALSIKVFTLVWFCIFLLWFGFVFSSASPLFKALLYKSNSPRPTLSLPLPLIPSLSLSGNAYLAVSLTRVISALLLLFGVCVNVFVFGNLLQKQLM